MAIKTDAVGKSWPSTTYQVSREKIRDVVAPPMFAVVYAMPSLGPAMFDPEVGINFARLVHGGQTFEWDEPACSGDEITTTATLVSATEKLDNGFYVFETTSVNGAGAEVVRGTWTNIVRGG